MLNHPRLHKRVRQLLIFLPILLLVYLLLAYMIMPRFWRRRERHAAISSVPKTTFGADGLPGDPLNVALVGTHEEVTCAFLKAGWQPADALTLRSGLGIVMSVLLRRPDPQAPVSSLYLWGRIQDLVFEQAVGKSAKQRHHVRLWKAPGLVEDRPFWIGAATFDIGVELSHTTGQVTHRIAPNVDAERDSLMAELQKTGLVQRVFQAEGVGSVLNGRNAGGDWYYSDGERTVAVLINKAS